MRIGELAASAGTTAKTLRFYEQQGLLAQAERTPAGYRDYPREVVSRIDFIHRGKAAGFTLAQIRQILEIRDRGQAPCDHVRELIGTQLSDLEHQINELVALRDTIVQLRDQAATPEPGSCHADQVCRYL